MRTNYGKDFEAFWKKWPGRKDVVNDTYTKVGKAEAYGVWQGKKPCDNGMKMDDEDRRDAYVAATSTKFKYSSKQYLLDCVRWLKRRRWEDFI